MNLPLCRPLMDGSSPGCRCVQCQTLRWLRPWFPRVVAIQLSADRRRIVVVNVGEAAWEVWTGHGSSSLVQRRSVPPQLDRVWTAAGDESLGTPAFSHDGTRICVPLFGPSPGLHLLAPYRPPRRLTDGLDVDPRWMRASHTIAFYRQEGTGIRMLTVCGDAGA